MKNDRESERVGERGGGRELEIYGRETGQKKKGEIWKTQAQTARKEGVTAEEWEEEK